MWKVVAPIIIAIMIGVLVACGNNATPGSHTVNATIFWVGEAAGPENGNIANDVSSWDGGWVAHFGGIDDPNAQARTPDGLRPKAFAPKENPFYFALPYTDFTDAGQVKENAALVPWYDAALPSRPQTAALPAFSIIKNRWIEITYNGKTAYAQWEDAGPKNSDDVAYVFGSKAPQFARSGLDVSPATAAYVGFKGSGQLSWRFVTFSEVPAGPWRDKVTTSQIAW